MKDMSIHRFAALQSTPSIMRGLDRIFFDASNTKSFADCAARDAFRERWLGRYLEHYRQWAYVALTSEGAVAGYLVGCLDDPALSPRFADLPYFQVFRLLTARYPAHLHVNVDAAHRGHGIGAALVARFVSEAQQEKSPGVHVVTSRNARNVAFYARHGFAPAGYEGSGDAAIVFLARAL